MRRAAAGMDMDVIANALAIRSVISVAAVLGIAAIFDKIEPGFVFAAAFILVAGALFLGANPSGYGEWVVYVVGGIVNILSACALSVMPAIYGNYFGRESFSSIQGIALLAGGPLSSATGVAGGVIADTTGSYDAAFYLFAIISLVGAAIFIFAVSGR